MLFFKTIQLFLLPSVFSPALIFGGLFLLFFKKKKWGKIFVAIGFFCYWFFSITFITNFLMRPLETRYPKLQKADLGKANTIVLLLGGEESDVLRASEVLRISKIKSQKSKIIISGTDPLNPQKKETEEMKEFLVEQGITAKNIVLEGESRNTFENAKNVRELVGGEPFFLVTSAYHMPRAQETFQKLGMNPLLAPTDFKAEGQYDILDFFPDAKNLRNSDLALHEYFGILWYTLKY